MKYKIAAFLKSILPEVVVDKIKAIRRAKRLKEYYAVNKGEDFSKKIIIEDVSFDLFLNPHLNAGIDYHIYQHGSWEPAIAQLIKKFVPKGGVFLDIGANIGYHSMYAAVCAGPDGRVHAFEPIPRLVTQIKKSVVVNSFSQVTVHPCALSDKPGNATLSLIDENIGASSLKHVINQKTVAGTIEVSVRTLDTECADVSRIDLIKIDVEGNEFEAFKGGETLLRRFHPPIIMEFSHVLYEHDKKGKTAELVAWMNALGYSFFTLEGEQVDMSQITCSKKEQSDLLCLHST